MLELGDDGPAYHLALEEASPESMACFSSDR